MKIENLGKPLGPTHLTGAQVRPSSMPRSNVGESVQLSPLASTLQKAEAALAQTPEVDSKRVEEIKQAIRDGRFQIDANRIAGGLLAEVRQMLDSQAGHI
ncbi:MAG: flagellar biosynthesis anti-sigma factor FlgM [Azoarcus sp.]|jgi:negative regulator of flagellin synthesis FlgM|nr:flagellar biosynthesis anti-sigma factor FlgM [Azoarcus sp.]